MLPKARRLNAPKKRKSQKPKVCLAEESRKLDKEPAISYRTADKIGINGCIALIY
jgi:hypothetical protein